ALPRVSEPRQRARAVASVFLHLPRVDLGAAARDRPRSARSDRRGRLAWRAGPRSPHRAEHGADRVVRRGRLQSPGVERCRVAGWRDAAGRVASGAAGDCESNRRARAARERAPNRWHLVRGRELSPVRAPRTLVRGDDDGAGRRARAAAVRRQIRRGICHAAGVGAARLHVSVAARFAVRGVAAAVAVCRVVRAGRGPARRSAAAGCALDAVRGMRPAARRHRPLALDGRLGAERGGDSVRQSRPRLAIVAPGAGNAAPARSALLAGQGLAVLRRDAGRTYLALDYGHSGGGHGHPDRLNLLLSRGADRWLDDMGTGSYVDPSLHWYRSTLAHNAPLVNGRSQPRASGALLAWSEEAGDGWARAAATISESPAVRAERTLVALRHAALDVVRWHADEPVRFELPFHARVRIAN